MKGKLSLWPFGFHCTGTPIRVSADKLVWEFEKFGNPPVFCEEETSTVDEPELDVRRLYLYF